MAKDFEEEDSGMKERGYNFLISGTMDIIQLK